jgi:hypothetical protein
MNSEYDGGAQPPYPPPYAQERRRPARWVGGLLGGLVVLLAAVALVAALAGCGGSGGDRAKCKQAMKADLGTALVNPSAPPASEPPACRGLSKDELGQIVSELLAGK